MAERFNHKDLITGPYDPMELNRLWKNNLQAYKDHNNTVRFAVALALLAGACAPLSIDSNENKPGTTEVAGRDLPQPGVSTIENTPTKPQPTSTRASEQRENAELEGINHVELVKSLLERGVDVDISREMTTEERQQLEEQGADISGTRDAVVQRMKGGNKLILRVGDTGGWAWEVTASGDLKWSLTENEGSEKWNNHPNQVPAEGETSIVKIDVEREEGEQAGLFIYEGTAVGIYIKDGNVQRVFEPTTGEVVRIDGITSVEEQPAPTEVAFEDEWPNWVKEQFNPEKEKREIFNAESTKTDFSVEVSIIEDEKGWEVVKKDDDRITDFFLQVIADRMGVGYGQLIQNGNFNISDANILSIATRELEKRDSLSFNKLKFIIWERDPELNKQDQVPNFNLRYFGGNSYGDGNIWYDWAIDPEDPDTLYFLEGFGSNMMTDTVMQYHGIQNAFQMAGMLLLVTDSEWEQQGMKYTSGNEKISLPIDSPFFEELNQITEGSKLTIPSWINGTDEHNYSVYLTR